MLERPDVFSRLGDKIVVGVCVLASIWMMSASESQRIERASAWSHFLITPFEKSMHFAESLVSLRSENARLRAELAALRLDAAHVERERQRIAELDARAGFYRQDRGRLVPAEVIEVTLDPIPTQVKIQVFGDEPLAIMMPVVTETGIVGRIRQVAGDGTALVLLLTDEDSRITVEVARTGVRGILRYDGTHFVIDHVPQGEPVEVGDEVVTHDLGGTVPRGLLVGRVTEVSADPSEHFQRIEVESAVHFSALDRVYVVTRPGPWYSVLETYEADVDTTLVAPGGESAP